MSNLEKTASHLAVNYVLPIVSDVPGVKQVVGFRESGVKKGSIAAMAQSYQGDVKAGSQFSKMQSKAQGAQKPLPQDKGQKPQPQGGSRRPAATPSKPSGALKTAKPAGSKGKSAKK